MADLGAMAEMGASQKRVRATLPSGMGVTKLTPEQREQFKAEMREELIHAPREFHLQKYVDKYGISLSQAKNYKRQVTRDIEEARHEVLCQELAKAAPRYVPTAVTALGRALEIACREMERANGREQQGWVKAVRDTACAILDRIGSPEDYGKNIADLTLEEQAEELRQALLEMHVDEVTAQKAVDSMLRDARHVQPKPAPLPTPGLRLAD